MKQFSATLIAIASTAQAFNTSKYVTDWDDTVPECWAERPLQCGEAACETGEWCRDGECEEVRERQCPAHCPEGEGKAPGRYCTCEPMADIEAYFCGPEPEEEEGEGSGEGEGEGSGEGEGEGEGDMDGGDMSGEDDSGEDDEDDDADEEEEEEEAEPIETTGEPFAGIDLNHNGVDDFEEYVPPPEDCSCIEKNDFATIIFEDP